MLANESPCNVVSIQRSQKFRRFGIVRSRVLLVVDFLGHALCRIGVLGAFVCVLLRVRNVTYRFRLLIRQLA